MSFFLWVCLSGFLSLSRSSRVQSRDRDSCKVKLNLKLINNENFAIFIATWTENREMLFGISAEWTKNWRGRRFWACRGLFDFLSMEYSLHFIMSAIVFSSIRFYHLYISPLKVSISPFYMRSTHYNVLGLRLSLCQFEHPIAIQMLKKSKLKWISVEFCPPKIKANLKLVYWSEKYGSVWSKNAISCMLFHFSFIACHFISPLRWHFAQFGFFPFKEVLKDQTKVECI